MTDAPTRGLTVVCLASYFKGGEFLRECRKQGCHVILVTKEKERDEDWPRESIDEITTVPNDATPELFVHAVSQIGRRHKIDRLVALEEFDVVAAGLIREHLRLPGATSSEARIFRDKLVMRDLAHRAGIFVPDFVHVLNYNELGQFMERVPPPWVIKPRADVSAIGIKKLTDSEQVWRTIDALDARPDINEQSPYYLLERFVPGQVFHVDSLIDGGEVVFAGASRYGRPPMEVAHQGGVFISHTVEHGSDDERELFDLNKRLLKALGHKRGAAHAEFIKGAADGRFYFLEVAARVGGAFIAETLEAARGVNLWRGWAQIELAGGERPVDVRPTHDEYSGIVLSLARQEYPDTSDYSDAEVVYRVGKRHHVGLVVRSSRLERVKELLNDYARRFDTDFCAVAPPLERPPQ